LRAFKPFKPFNRWRSVKPLSPCGGSRAWPGLDPGFRVQSSK
jgi:hypothetical protein